MTAALKILVVEDSAKDAELMLRELRRAGLKLQARTVQTEPDFRLAIEEFRPLIILSDFSMPSFDGMRALVLSRELCPATPFIFVSGTLGEEYAIRALIDGGATDYVLKTNLMRLPAAIARALQEAGERAKRLEIESARRESDEALRRAQAMAGLAHIISGAGGAFESWSSTLPDMLGISPAAMPKNTREWLRLIHPDDRAAFRAGAIEAARTGARTEFEYRIRHADGSWVHARQIDEPTGGGLGKRWFGSIQDVTAQRHAAAALEASEARYRATFEQAAVGIVHTSLTGEIQMVNQAFCELTGQGRADAVQLHIRDVTHPEDMVQSNEARGKLLSAAGAPYQREMRLRRKDGTYLWVNVTTSLMRDVDGKPKQFVAVINDVSERRQAEQEMRRFRAAMDITIDSIYLTDPETMRFVYVNDTACRRLGYAREELMRKTSYELVGKQRGEIERDYQAVIAAGDRGTSSESRFVRKDGSEGWTELHRRALRIDGSILIVTLGRDITERKLAERELTESEERFRSLTKLSSDWFWQTDIEHRFVDTPARVTAITGMTANAYVGKRRWEVPGLMPTSGGWDAHRKVLERRESYRDLELVQLKADGTRVYLQVSGEPIYDAAGVFSGYRGTAKDITVQKRDEEELRRFRLAMDGSADIILLIDRATMKHVDCNDTACRLLGYTREELLRMGPAETLPVSREELERTYDELIQSQAPAAGMSSYYRCKDGSKLPFESTRRLLRSGDSWLIVAISRDIRDRLASENALRESEARFRSLTELSSDWYWEQDAEFRFSGLSGAREDQVGRRRWELPGVTPVSASWDEHKALLQAHRSFRDFEYKRIGPDGVERYLSISGEPVRDESGTFKGYRGVGKDITERKLQQHKIERLIRVHAVLSGINGAIVRIRDRGELYREACRIALQDGGFRMAWAGVVRRDLGRIEPVAWEGTDEAYIRAMPLDLDEAASGRISLGGRAVRARAPVVSDDMANDPRVILREQAGGRGFHALAILPLLEGGEVAGVLALYAAEVRFFDAEEMKLLSELAGDISFALEVIGKEEKLNYLALHDPLTGLANRTLFIERLGQSIQNAGQAGAKFALASLDVERLTTVNESLGRQAGDALLRAIGDRLSRAAGAASVARIASDNFAIMLPTVKGRSEAGRVIANLVRTCFGEPLTLEGTEIKAAAKTGVSLFPNDGEDAETLLANAEAAHRKAKETGERHVFYTPELTERTGVSLTLETKLRRALERDEFVLHYQPKIEVDGRRIVGTEALIRWQSPELGLVPPGKFIPLMEETGMILDVGTWALRRASRDHRRWTEMNLRPPRVAVNVSAIQLRQKDFVKAVEEAIMEGVAPTGIDLEITESLVMEDIEGNIGKLREVRALGVGLAIDDFGTGYSSLSYLAKLPVQILKIDRSFVITMLNEPDTMTLVQTIISLAHSLRLKVVAEGVDAEEQAKVLRLLRCDQMQGYLFSKPVPFDAVTALLKQGS